MSFCYNRLYHTKERKDNAKLEKVTGGYASIPSQKDDFEVADGE